ncbi:MAG: FAD-dependent oxidoreductase [Acidobacteria bacterium]|nr:FAD-dependent oxidoreductase [Acidobacteriota bacterium]
MSVGRKRVVVVGGSFGGVNAAYELRRRLPQDAEITVISRDAEFTFIPSLPCVIMGWREPSRIQVGLDTPLRRRGIRFVHDEVKELDPQKCEIRTAGQIHPYDAVVIASGAELDYAAVPGLGPEGGHTFSTFTPAEATAARDALRKVIAADQGRIVIGAAAGASCVGPAYEIAMMIDTALKRLRKRHRFSIAFITPEPFLGHFGVGGIGSSPGMVQDEFADRHIDSVVNARIASAGPDSLILADGSEHPFDFPLIIPAFLGSPFVRGVDGLANPKGFIPVTPQLASTKVANIYAAGVAVAIAPPGPTPVPVAVPKTGHMTELMAQAAARNIAAEFTGGVKVDGMTLPSTCIADAGDTAFYMSAYPFLPPRNKVIVKRGKWARYLKLTFERYYLARIRHDLPSMDFGW